MSFFHMREVLSPSGSPVRGGVWSWNTVILTSTDAPAAKEFMSKHVHTTVVSEIDPVCGMSVNPSSAAGQVEHKGKTYYFCSKHCVARFEQDPAKFLGKSSSPLVKLSARKPLKPSENSTAAKEKDPVCGMDVDPAKTRHRLEHDGKTYYFCCGGCLEKFRADPARYLTPKPSVNLVQLGAAGMASAPSKSASASATPSTADRYYVCPMCPEVRQ